MFGSTGAFAQMPDGTLVNFAMTSKIQQVNSSIVVTYPNGVKDTFNYPNATAAQNALTGIADFLTSQAGILTLKSITPSTAAGGSPVNAVLLGTGFQYDFSGGSFLGTVTVGGAGTSIVFVNSNTLLLSFTAPAIGTYDVVYTPTAGGAVTLTGAWVST